jgi:hypothetical protein
MPLVIPTSAEPRDPMTPSSFAPPSGVWISRAYVGLTVVTASAVRIPCFNRLIAP